MSRCKSFGSVQFFYSLQTQVVAQVVLNVCLEESDISDYNDKTTTPARVDDKWRVCKQIWNFPIHATSNIVI